MSYLGKKYLWNFLKENGFNPSQMKKMGYEKYRGSEWIVDEKIHLFRNSRTLSVSIYEYNEIEEKRIETELHSFYYKNEKWEKQYQRIKKEIKIY